MSPVSIALGAVAGVESPTMRAYRLENPVQNYAWGSVAGLADCLGLANPSGRPVAELWIGAHPKAPSLSTLR